MSTSAQAIPGLIELGRKNQAGGYVGIDGSGDVIGTFAQRRDTAANIAGIVLADGELAFTSDTQEMFIGDGSTTGGLFLRQKIQRKNKAYASSEIITGPSSGSATDTTSILFPKVPGASYRVKVFAVFAGDSSNTSNFGIIVHQQGLPSLYGGASLKILGQATWSDNTVSDAVLENWQTYSISNSTWFPGLGFYLATNLTKAACRFVGEVTFQVDADPANSAGPIAITAVPRISSPSAATCDMVVECERIA